MQSYAQTIRESIWGKLSEIFLKYTGGKTSIVSTQIEAIVREVLKETDQTEVDYVVKNLFRLDSDGSGSIDFPEFANFLLKRHCGELALQRRHKRGGIKHGAQRKLTLEEFIALLNDSYSFLGVTVDPAQIETIFKEYDKDGDSLITYVEYFKFIETAVCKPKTTAPAPVPVPAPVPPPPRPTKDYKSRLRGLFWWLLKRMYDFYDKDHNKLLDPREIETLIREVLDQTSVKEIEFVLQSIFHMDTQGHSGISFEVFAVSFIRYLAELGLSRWSHNHPNGERKFDSADFIVIFRNSYTCIGASRVTDRLLLKFSVVIDANHDGWISFAEYLAWVTEFLTVLVYNWTEYYIIEDDEGLDAGKDWILPEEIKKPEPVLTTTVASGVLCPYTFSSLDLARRTRARMLLVLEKFDADKNRLFDEKEIVTILVQIMKSDELDIFYVIANVFRYDNDGDKKVTYGELADFFLEVHNGELAIQRLHKLKTYAKGAQRIMDLKEFIKTLTYALSFIEITATELEYSTLFSEIDLDKDGWISYKEYFEFLRFYFGSLSQVKKEEKLEPSPKPIEIPADPYAGLSPEERFARITIDALLLLLKQYKLQPFDRNEIARLLREIFGLNDSEIDYVIKNFFRYDVSKNGYFLDTEMAKIFLELFFAEIILLRQHRLRLIVKWAERLIDLNEFLTLVALSTTWMKVQHEKSLLELIFKNIDTNHDGFISYKEYITFIRRYLGGHAGDLEGGWWFPDPPVSDPAAEQEAFYTDIWSELRALYKHYVKGQFLTEQELELLIVQVLKESSKRDLEYVFWNMFRVDPNSDRKIEFEEFAPFILKHAGEIGLRNFHLEHKAGKSQLNEAEFKLVVRNAFAFLKSIAKHDHALNVVFKKLANGTDSVSYGAYVGWVFKNIAAKVR